MRDGCRDRERSKRMHTHAHAHTHTLSCIHLAALQCRWPFCMWNFMPSKTRIIWHVYKSLTPTFDPSHFNYIWTQLCLYLALSTCHLKWIHASSKIESTFTISKHLNCILFIQNSSIYYVMFHIKFTNIHEVWQNTKIMNKLLVHLIGYCIHSSKIIQREDHSLWFLILQHTSS